MKNHGKKLRSYILAHKVKAIIILIILLGGGYWVYGKITSTTGNIRYLTAKVEKGTIVASISGTGQVSALNQVDIKSKVSGDVLYLSAQNGQRIGASALIAKLDTKDAEKSVRDAEANLESAKISLAKLEIQESKENMDANLAQAYDDGFNSIANAFLDLPGIMTGLNDMFLKSTISTSQWNVDWYEGQTATEDQDKAFIYKQNFIDSYNVAQKAYDTNSADYKLVSRNSDTAAIEKTILQTYETTKLISDTVKNANNYVDFVNDSMVKHNFSVPAIIITHKTSLNSYTGKTNTHLLNLLSIKTSIKSYKDAFPNSSLDIQSSELNVKQKENALRDAQDKLADYSMRAPFAGTIAKINIKKSDSVSSGTIVATLITEKQIAEISLNEVDVAKIKIGQKATLTFDAVPNLAISGVVAEIDSVGTVSQGVVTYIVKISFDTQDNRVKAAMSVSAAIITDVKQEVLIVPNSAIKSQAGTSYVEMFDAPLVLPTDGLIGSISKIAPRKIQVAVGLSNDSKTEITSGLKEGDEIITRTILPTTTTATTTAPSIFGSPAGGNRGGGGRS